MHVNTMTFSLKSGLVDRVIFFSFFLIAPTIQQTRCKVWINRFIPKDGSVHLSDVTSMYTAICVMGPFTKSLLRELTDADLSSKAFPFFTFKVFIKIFDKNKKKE